MTVKSRKAEVHPLHILTWKKQLIEGCMELSFTWLLIQQWPLTDFHMETHNNLKGKSSSLTDVTVGLFFHAPFQPIFNKTMILKCMFRPWVLLGNMCNS